MRKLYKITIETDDDNFYRLTPDQESINYGAQTFVFKADDVMLKNFLRRCKMADDSTTPRSYRGVTYKEIIDTIKLGTSSVYVFRHMYPKSQEELEKIIR